MPAFSLPRRKRSVLMLAALAPLASLAAAQIRPQSIVVNPGPAVTSLTLIDADSGRPVPGYDPIPAGARLKLSALPRHLNVRANVAPGVGRVRFVWENGQTRLELGVPFTLCGDQPDRKTRKDHYFACDPGVFSPGEHRITVTPYATWSPNVSGPALIWVFSVER